MRDSPPQVDFLVVTALDDEAGPVRQRLDNGRLDGGELIGEVRRRDGAGSHIVAHANLGGMGPDRAQQVTREVIRQRSPLCVVLTGIAAGFPEKGVRLGDVLVPEFILDYESAKLRDTQEGDIEVEHRSWPLPVAFWPWYLARELGSESGDWVSQIRAERPEAGTPSVHAGPRSILGSGFKVVAAEFSEARQWLTKGDYGKWAIGLEMEARGALVACTMTHTPFLVVKAAQDPASAEKDRWDKDLWRPYACDAAAAFTIEFIRRYRVSESDLAADHRRQVLELLRSFKDIWERPRFKYDVRVADSYTEYKRDVLGPRTSTAALIPNAARPFIALHGRGGAGKTRIAQEILRPALEERLLPFYLGFRHSPQAETNGDEDSLLSTTLASGVPRRTRAELGHLARQHNLLAVIDGLHELSREGQVVLLRYFQQLSQAGTCYIVATVRRGWSESLIGFTHLALEPLTDEAMREAFEDPQFGFGRGSFGELDESRKEIFRHPFFLSLALRTRDRRLVGGNLPSKVFHVFFEGRLQLNLQAQDALAEAAFGALKADATLNARKFTEGAGEMAQVLEEAGIFNATGGFEHDLWRDFLVGRHLANKGARWIHRTFDRATSYGGALECLRLALEQIASIEGRDELLKSIYDWNYYAAADCIRFVGAEDSDVALSEEVQTAVLASIAEKRFDRILRTRQRAEEALAHQQTQLASRLMVDTRDDLIRLLGPIASEHTWYQRWQQLFLEPVGQAQDALEAIRNVDPLIGWAAANAIRRSRAGSAGEARLRAMYKEYRSSDKAEAAETVRWRIVHALGAFPGEANADLLAEALRTDPYHWVRYGSARALMEIAVASRRDRRMTTLSMLLSALRELGNTPTWARRRIIREVVEAADVSGTQPDWIEDIGPFLRKVIGEVDTFYRNELENRLTEVIG